MTLTEVFSEIEKLALSDKQALLEQLTLELSSEEIESVEQDELLFLTRLREKGLISGLPRQIPDDEIRRDFKRININGKPISETIIEERG